MKNNNIKELSKYEQEQDLIQNKNDIKPQYRYTRSNKELDKLAQNMTIFSKFASIDNDGNYTTNGLLKSNDFYLTIYQNPLSNNYQNDLRYLEFMNQEDLQNNLEEVWKNIDQTTAKFVDILILKQTEQGFTNEVTEVSLKEYATLLNGGKEPTRSQINKAREKANKSMEALKFVGYKFKPNKKSTYYVEVMLYGGTRAINKGKIYFKFNRDFLNMNFAKGNSYLTILPIKLLAINEKTNPNSYLIGRKLLSLRRINKGKAIREKVFAVKTLYEYVYTLPRYNKVNYYFVKKIIEPFERDLDAIEKTGLLKWNYDKEYIDKLEDKNHKITFEDWLNAKIEIEWLDEFNNQDNSITAGREKQKKLAKKNK